MTRFACPQRRIEKGHVIEIDMNEIKEPILCWAISPAWPMTLMPWAS